MKLHNKMVEEPFRPPFRRDTEGSLFFCSYPETGHAEMAAASARAGRKILMVRFGGVKGGGREQFGGHRIAVFPELFHEGKGCGFLPISGPCLLIWVGSWISKNRRASSSKETFAGS